MSTWSGRASWGGQGDADEGAALIGTFDVNRPAMHLDDAAGRRQAEARAAILRGEERVEHPRPHVLRDTGALVPDADLTCGAAVRADVHGNPTAALHRLRGVLEQIR